MALKLPRCPMICKATGFAGLKLILRERCTVRIRPGQCALDKRAGPATVLALRIMTDPRYTKLAKLLIEYSTALKKGDRILLDMIDVPDEMTIELIRVARARGAVPFVETRHTRVGREMLRGIDEKHAESVRDLELLRMKKMQAYIAIRGSENASENA